jgi:glutathione synthase/RimK-type ligase-like ATP-grasp enzyme
VLAGADAKVRKAFAGWHTTPDYYGTITELLGAEMVLDLAIGRVGSLSEFDVLRAARLRDMVGMPGQGFQSALRFRDKWLMKTIAGEAGVAVPRMVLVEAVGTLPHRLGEVGLPAVVKPRWMAAGVGVKVVRDFSSCSEVMQLLSGHVQPFELMVEEFIDAPLLHVDGLMLDGAVLAAVAGEYTDVQGQAAGSALLDEADPRSALLAAAAAKVIAALGSPPHVQAFHASFFIGGSHDGAPVLCEISSRTGGLGVPAMVEAVTGINLRRETMLGQLGLPPTPFSPVRLGSSGYLAMPARAGKLVSAPPSIPFDWVVAPQLTGRAGAVYSEARAGADIVMQATVVGSAQAEVRSRLEELAAWWSSETVWETPC